MSLPWLSPVGVWGPRRWPESAQSRPQQLAADQEAHQRGHPEGGNSSPQVPTSDSACHNPSWWPSGMQTDELLDYLSSSLASRLLPIRSPSWTCSWTDTVWRFPKWPTVWWATRSSSWTTTPSCRPRSPPTPGSVTTRPSGTWRRGEGPECVALIKLGSRTRGEVDLVLTFVEKISL